MDITAFDINNFRDEFKERLEQLLDELIDDDNHLTVDVESANNFIVDEATKILVEGMIDLEEE